LGRCKYIIAIHHAFFCSLLLKKRGKIFSAEMKTRRLTDKPMANGHIDSRLKIFDIEHPAGYLDIHPTCVERSG
jgi:hypothetical protein